MTERNKNLRNLTEVNWYRESTFVSASDGKGNRIFGDGTYVLRFIGDVKFQIGETSHINRMVEVMDNLKKQEKAEPIQLPSNSYMKKLNKATNKRYSVCKIVGREIFVDCRLLYEMTKVLGDTKGYSAKLEGYTTGNKRVERTAIYLKGQNGDGLLMPFDCKTRKCE